MKHAIKPALPIHVSDIAAIYNHAIRSSTATFDCSEKTDEQQHAWLTDHTKRFPVHVIEQQSRIAGWSALSPWSKREAYRDTAEFSLFLHPDFLRQGLGTALMNHGIQIANELGFHSLIARISGENEASMILFKKMHYQCIGIMREVGIKFNRRIDVHLYQRMLKV